MSNGIKIEEVVAWTDDGENWLGVSHEYCLCGKITCAYCNQRHPAYSSNMRPQVAELGDHNTVPVELLRQNNITTQGHLVPNTDTKTQKLLDLPTELHREIMGYVVAHELQRSSITDNTVLAGGWSTSADPTGHVLNQSTKACAQLYDAAFKELIKVLKLGIASSRRLEDTEIPPPHERLDEIKEFRPGFINTLRQVELDAQISHDCYISCFDFVDHEHRVKDLLQFIDLVPQFMPHLRRFFVKFVIFDYVLVGEEDDYDFLDPDEALEYTPFDLVNPSEKVEKQVARVKSNLTYIIATLKELRPITKGVKMATHSYEELRNNRTVVEETEEEARDLTAEEVCERVCEVKNVEKLYIL